MTKCLTSRQSANHARMSLEKYIRSSDFQHLKDAHQILSDAIQAEYDKDKQLTSRQLDNYAKTSIDEYLNSGNLNHLKDASCIYHMFKLKTSLIEKISEMKARNYS